MGVCLNPEKIIYSFGGAQGPSCRALVTHPDLNIFFAVDVTSASIQVYTQGGDYVTTYTLQINTFCPWGIAYKAQSLYLSDIRGNRLLRLSDFGIHVNSEFNCKDCPRLSHPKGLDCDEECNVYIADFDNNRICVFDNELEFSHKINNQQLTRPRDVKVVAGDLLVLATDKPFILVFSLSGKMLRVLNKLIPSVIEPWFFSVEKNCILVSDYCSHSFKRFNHEGEFEEELVRFEYERTYVSVFGVCVTSDKNIVVSISDKEHPFLTLTN